jgi:hypothetical protein
MWVSRTSATHRSHSSKRSGNDEATPALPMRWRSSGPDGGEPARASEQQYADLAAVERLVQHREVRDHHGEQPEAGRPRGHHDGSRRPGDVAAEPEREQRRSGDVQGVRERVTTSLDPIHERGAPQDQGVAQQGEGHPADQQEEEEEGRRPGQDPLAGLDRLAAHADPSPRTPEQPEQDPA